MAIHWNSLEFIMEFMAQRGSELPKTTEQSLNTRILIMPGRSAQRRT